MENQAYGASFFNEIYPIDSNTSIIVNYGNGAIDALSTESLANVLHGSESAALQRYMRQRGYITELTKEQEIEKRNAYAQKLLSLDAKQMENPHFVFIPSYNCNLGCAYCFVCGAKHTGTITAARNIRNRLFTQEVLEAAFRFIDGKRGRTSSISFFGGEPFLLRNKSVVEKVTAYAVSWNIPLSAITNGTELSHYLDVLQHFTNLQITLDGPAYIHNTSRPYKSGAPSFERIVANLELLMRHTDTSVKLRCNIDKRSMPQYESMAEELSSQAWFDKERISIYGSPIIDNEDVFPNIFTSAQDFIETAKIYIKNKERLLQLMERFAFPIISTTNQAEKNTRYSFLRPSIHFCSSEIATSILSPDGYLYACLELVANPQYSTGRFYPNITETEQAEKWRDRSILTIEPCRTCKYALVCSGGCASKSFHKNGDMYKVCCTDYSYVMKEYSQLYYQIRIRKQDE